MFKLSDSGHRSAGMALYFSKMEVEESSEVLIYDFPNIVAAVGGSLGLFLGISCMDFGKLLREWIFERVDRLG